MGRYTNSPIRSIMVTMNALKESIMWTWHTAVYIWDNLKLLFSKKNEQSLKLIASGDKALALNGNNNNITIDNRNITYYNIVVIPGYSNDTQSFTGLNNPFIFRPYGISPSTQPCEPRPIDTHTA